MKSPENGWKVNLLTIDWEHQKAFPSLCLSSHRLSLFTLLFSPLPQNDWSHAFFGSLYPPQFLPDWWRRRGVQQDVGFDSQSVREWRHTHPQQPTRWIWQQTQTRHWRWALNFENQNEIESCLWLDLKSNVCREVTLWSLSLSHLMKADNHDCVTGWSLEHYTKPFLV